MSVHTEIGDPVARLPCLKNAVVMSRFPVANVLVFRREERGVRPEVNCVNLPWRMQVSPSQSSSNIPRRYFEILIRSRNALRYLNSTKFSRFSDFFLSARYDWLTWGNLDLRISLPFAVSSRSVFRQLTLSPTAVSVLKFACWIISWLNWSLCTKENAFRRTREWCFFEECLVRNRKK